MWFQQSIEAICSHDPLELAKHSSSAQLKKTLKVSTNAKSFIDFQSFHRTIILVQETWTKVDFLMHQQLIPSYTHGAGKVLISKSIFEPVMKLE